jgi:putative FmdB family regulatory protein
VPQYAFSCAACGPLDVWRPVAEAGNELRCPTCDAPAQRLFTAPGLARMPAAIRGAREREERSAQAPEVVSTKTGRPMPGHGHSHGNGHGAPWAHRH